jgi:2-polyprenyl-3-methyl-5-hydroxy-6-metoxy-1,4-benzoquinol methylase
MSTDPEIVSFYNQKYLTDISTHGYYKEKIDFYISHLEKFSKNKKLKILDVACNEGGLTEKYLKYGEVVGIDINKRSVAKCRKRGIKCLQTSIEKMPSKYNNYFDVIIAGDIIEHVFATDDFVRNLHKKLKKGGMLLLTTANAASIGRRIMLILGKNPFLEYSLELPYRDLNVGHIRYYTVSDMYLQMKHCGFKNTKVYGDRINLTEKIYIPQIVAKHLPTISRYMHVTAQK